MGVCSSSRQQSLAWHFASVASAVWFGNVKVIMTGLAARIRRFLKSEEGPTAVEYAIMLALIILVCVFAITTLGNNAKGVFNSVSF